MTIRTLSVGDVVTGSGYDNDGKLGVYTGSVVNLNHLGCVQIMWSDNPYCAKCAWVKL